MKPSEAIKIINGLIKSVELVYNSNPLTDKGLKFAGLDMQGVSVNEMNIDYGKSKESNKKGQMFVRLGG